MVLNPAKAPVKDPVKAIVFDIGRVLVEWDIGALYRKLIADPSRCDHILNHVITEAWAMAHDDGTPLAEMVAARTREFPDFAAEIAVYAPRWLETIPGPVPGMPVLVAGLAARGIPLFAITNFGPETWAMFRAGFPLLDHFGDIVVSGEERITKPDPRIFALAARRFGYAPPQMLFIDDNLANIRAAAELGWQTHHFQDADTLEEDLRGRGLFA